ncbi:MAG: sigma-70 family RNA polymerase sigma factor, partial [Proteobacteria bacterium]|nr:sigma-70 family RNA polymerase sigma factor [Pseudomonadota bacterium]
LSWIHFVHFTGHRKKKLFGYLMRLTGNYQLASDIMQESFARYLEHYDSQTQNVSLLFTIARNLVWDNSRKKTDNKEMENDIADVTFNPEEQLLVRESYRNVLSAMQKLKKDQRDLLALTVSSDLSYREIANILGISETNVKVKVHRARILLKELLQTGDD